MVAPGRIPCINPRCRRTAPAERYDAGTEIICGKCFRALPAELRARYRKLGRDNDRLLPLVEKRVAKHSIAPHIVDRLHGNMERRDARLWGEIKRRFAAEAPPVGLENFLREAGLA